MNLTNHLQTLPKSANVPVKSGQPLHIMSVSMTNTVEPTLIGSDSKATSPAPRQGYPSHKFRYAGRPWRIFKRSHKSEASWYIEFELDKKRELKSLETSSKAHAEAEAKSYIDEFLAKRRDARRGIVAPKSALKYSPLSAIIGRARTEDFGLLLQLPTANSAGERARKLYGWSLRWVLRVALGIEDDAVDQLTTEVLNRDTVRAFFDRVSQNAAALPNQADRINYLHNAYQFFTNSQALLAPRPLEAMRSTHNLVLPDLTAWREGRKVFGQSLPARNKSELPSDAVLRRTLREWIRIAQTPGYALPGGDHTSLKKVLGPDLPVRPLSELDRRNLFITVGLELSCGLRIAETRKVRRDWVTTEAGLPLLRDLRVDVKNRTGKIEISPLDPFWHILWFWIRKNGWDVGPEELLISGDASDLEWPERHGSRWLRHLGWETSKTNHALRDYSASMITMRYDIGQACDWCRHSTIATTEKSYNRFVKLSKRVDPRKLRWLRWSKFIVGS